MTIQALVTFEQVYVDEEDENHCTLCADEQREEEKEQRQTGASHDRQSE